MISISDGMPLPEPAFRTALDEGRMWKQKWLGKRRITLIATVPWRRQPRGKQARKAAFAANARKMRHWTAEYKSRWHALGWRAAAMTHDVRAKRGTAA